MILKLTDGEFLKAIFGDEYLTAYVNDFSYPPDQIPSEQHLAAWSGDHYSRYQFKPDTNRYFCISTFDNDEQGVARRRKSLWKSAHCWVIDDVREKMDAVKAARLPEPSWILETSQGSEQWGYILQQPETVANRIDNLNDGIIEAMSYNGKDSGMKSITRLVKLPSSINNKTNKLYKGRPWHSVMKLWKPDNKVTLDQLAQVFDIDLNAPRRDVSGGADDLPDHPLLHMPDVIKVKERRSAGRYDITCPWVHEHTGEDDSGTAIFTGHDNIGFACHHGHCQGKTANDLLNYIETKRTGFKAELTAWQANSAFSKVESTTPTLLPAGVPPPPPADDDAISGELIPAPPVSSIAALEAKMYAEEPASDGAAKYGRLLLEVAEDMSPDVKIQYHRKIQDMTHWTKVEIRAIIKDIKVEARKKLSEGMDDSDFYGRFTFVQELNKFYEFDTKMYFTPDSFTNSFAHMDVEVRQKALLGETRQSHKLDYAPKRDRYFTEHGINYANMWTDEHQPLGYEGDISRWFDHFAALGWHGAERDHMIQWMAWTILHPDVKINHILLLGGREGTGKDFLLYPLMKAMEGNTKLIEGDALTDSFNDYVLGVKYLQVNEAELGDRSEAMAISNKLKPLAAAPPERLSVNPKGVTRMEVRNIVNVSMTTNSPTPIRTNGASRRYYAMWTDVNTRDENNNTTADWHAYWVDRWSWMKDQQGWQSVVWFLRNCVDFKGFNAGAAPDMTGFMRDIIESSQSTTLQDLNVLVREKEHFFESDIITREDAVATMRNEFSRNKLSLQTEARFISGQSVSRELPNVNGVMKMRVNNKVMFILRNQQLYANMPTELLVAAHAKQTSKYREQNNAG